MSETELMGDALLARKKKTPKEWGVLLVNLGTPRSPSPSDVGDYLKEFLLDPEVIDIPWIARQILVRGIIVPTRRKTSASLYRKIWTPEGSPLALHTAGLAAEMKSLLPEFAVACAFRYGSPSIKESLQDLDYKRVKKVIVVPLYPQYATSTTRTTERELDALLAWKKYEKLVFIPSFHSEPFYLEAQARTINAHRARGSHLLFSFHGIPVRHVTKNHPACSGCVGKPSCQKEGDAYCYRRQCTETAEALASRLGLATGDWTVSYQSRLGRAEWLKPSTEDTIRELAARGIKNLTVAVPGFAADCLETLEELDHAAREIFMKAGGETWTRVPCLNADPEWARGLADWIRTQTTEEPEDGKTAT